MYNTLRTPRDNTVLVKKMGKTKITIGTELGRFWVSVDVNVKNDYYLGGECDKQCPSLSKEFYSLKEAIIYAEECFEIAEKIVSYENDKGTYVAKQVAELKQRDGMNGWNIPVAK